MEKLINLFLKCLETLGEMEMRRTGNIING